MPEALKVSVLAHTIALFKSKTTAADRRASERCHHLRREQQHEAGVYRRRGPDGRGWRGEPTSLRFDGPRARGRMRHIGREGG